MRGCARCTSPRIGAAATAGTRKADRRYCRPTTSARRKGAPWFGAGDGFAAYPALAAALGLADCDASLLPDARAILELALPRLAAGEAVDAAHALPLYVRHRVALTTAERAAGARL